MASDLLTNRVLWNDFSRLPSQLDQITWKWGIHTNHHFIKGSFFLDIAKFIEMNFKLWSKWFNHWFNWYFYSRLTNVMYNYLDFFVQLFLSSGITWSNLCYLGQLLLCSLLRTFPEASRTEGWLSHQETSLKDITCSTALSLTPSCTSEVRFLPKDMVTFGPSSASWLSIDIPIYSAVFTQLF